MKGLLVVDVQNCFIDGTLPVPGAIEIVAPIQRLIRRIVIGELPGYNFVGFSRCHHPIDHCSFKHMGGLYPTHGVANTEDAELQAGLDAMAVRYGLPIYSKGLRADREEYSAFDNEALHRDLQAAAVRKLYLCGLAENICVKATARAATKRGYSVVILHEFCRAVSM